MGDHVAEAAIRANIPPDALGAAILEVSGLVGGAIAGDVAEKTYRSHANKKNEEKRKKGGST